MDKGVRGGHGIGGKREMRCLTLPDSFFDHLFMQLSVRQLLFRLHFRRQEERNRRATLQFSNERGLQRRRNRLERLREDIQVQMRASKGERQQRHLLKL